MNQILLEKFPLIVRCMDYERLKRGNRELPSALIKGVFASSQQTQLDNALMVARGLVKIITLLGSDKVCKDFPLPQDPKMKEDRCRSVRRKDRVEEVAPKIVKIHERQGSIRSKLKFHRRSPQHGTSQSRASG